MLQFHNSLFNPESVEQRVFLNFVSLQSNANKFYIIEFQEGSGTQPFCIYTEYGRMGRTPRQESRYFSSRETANQFFHSLLSSKKAKGYELVAIEEDFDDLFTPRINQIHNRSLRIEPNSLSLHTQLGELSEIQLHRGLQILEEIEERLMKDSSDLLYLSNKFYSLIPIVFGNKINMNDSVLDTHEKLYQRKEWLLNNLNALDNISG
ncbi:WGR domain-containing protein [Bacillus sp. M6-12]|uniref:WGR domain-containing protein n=1 Tax=Bacillus sp. M6-12 TaxID=2054166 RepID=UPI0015E0828D|nr:WGR domain-containing protein [Bacillus sp. M6-12]